MSGSKLRQAVKALPGYRGARRAWESLVTAGASEEQWARVVMNRETTALIANLRPERLDALEISGDEWGRKVRFKSYRSAHYPEIDICEAPLPATFDLVIAEQVFEHLLWPYRAARHVHQMLRPGGHALITTPFLIRVHRNPVDCSRWTELGMKHLLAEAGFELGKIRTGSWGNRACVKGNFERWAGYRAGLHSLRNEPDYPIVVWVLAEK